jgi:CheY-like chemotaxis protein
MTATPSADSPLPPKTRRFVHDLRNCLASMRAGANMLQRSTDKPPIVAKVADNMYEQVQEMLNLVDEFIGRAPATDDNVSSDPVSTDTHAASVKSLRILIADDNTDAANTLATFLRLSGHSPVVAFDGGEALQLAADERPDVMLVDLTMPTLNGFEVARNIRAQPWGATVRIIAVSGWFSPEDIDRASHAGFDAHMSKPIDMDALPAMLQAAH